VQDAEALLFIDYDQAEILKEHIAEIKAMRSDNDIDAACAELLEHLALLACERTGSTFRSARIIEHARAERFRNAAARAQWSG